MKADYRQLPQLCSRCRNRDIRGFPKPASDGQFFRSRKCHRRPVWVCNKCLQNPVRHNRAGKETPPEREVRLALMTFGEQFVPEYKLGPFVYDFALPNLNLLIEVDSYTWHHTARKKITDARKHCLAENHGWVLQRVKSGPKLGKRACALVRERRLQLVRFNEEDEEIVRMVYEEKYGGGGN